MARNIRPITRYHKEEMTPEYADSLRELLIHKELMGEDDWWQEDKNDAKTSQTSQNEH